MGFRVLGFRFLLRSSGFNCCRGVVIMSYRGFGSVARRAMTETKCYGTNYVDECGDPED